LQNERPGRGGNDESMAKERARYERALRKCLEIFKEEGIV
jgi:3-hydroxybutyryl-CoA dehydrogenase